LFESLAKGNLADEKTKYEMELAKEKEKHKNELAHEMSCVSDEWVRSLLESLN